MHEFKKGDLLKRRGYGYGLVVTTVISKELYKVYWFRDNTTTSFFVESY